MVLAVLLSPVTAFGRTPAPAASPGPLAALESALEHGRYLEALAGAAKIAGRERDEASGIAGEALLQLGRYAEAERLLAETLKQSPRALRARRALGLVYRATGQRAVEQAVWNRFFDDYESGALDKKRARDLAYVAEAARYLGSWQDANDTFRDAVAADVKGPDGARANVAWAALFLEKYDAGHAEQSLEEALKILPADPDAHALLARVKLEQGYDVAGAERQLAAALKSNPRHAGALDLRAEILADNQQYEEALAVLSAVLALNPEDARARTIAAAAYLLRGDQASFARERDRVLKTNPLASSFFHGVAEFLVKEHRYLEANALEEEAIRLEPKDYVALAGLGTNLLRLGEDRRGVEVLKRAWEGDRYNVRTYNLLNLFDQVIPKRYTLVAGKPFRFRVPVEERAIVERYVRPLVAREYAELERRYGFQPEGPLTIELFADPNHYAVRTVGLPGLEALGVTFGKVITGMSPHGGQFNWGMMLWHEVAHIFSIQLSRSRVPRWFTEGLSEYETAREQPEWTRRTHAELYRALHDGTMLPVAELNAAFNRARDLQHVVVAYHQAAETVAFLIRRWGFPKVVEALKLYAAGRQTREVLRAVTGLELAAFDAAFRADLEPRLSAYAGRFFVRPADYSDVEALQARLETNPGDARAKALYALALLKAHQGERARTLIEEALKAAAPAKEALFARAELAMAEKDAGGGAALARTADRRRGGRLRRTHPPERARGQAG